MIIEDDNHEFNSHSPPTCKMLYVMLKVVQTKNVLTFKNFYSFFGLSR